MAGRKDFLKFSNLPEVTEIEGTDIFAIEKASGKGRRITKYNLFDGLLGDYYEKTDFINSSAGAGDAGKPVKLDASGILDLTFILTGVDGGNASSGTAGRALDGGDST